MHGRGRWYQGGRQGRPPRHDPDTGYKLVAGVAAGCFAAWLLTALISAVLSVVAGVFSSPGASFLIFWAIAAALAYRYLKTRKAKGWNLRRETRRIEIDFHDEREPREYRQEHYDDGDDDRRRDDAGKERVEKAKADRLGAWEVIQGLFAGFCVVLAVNLSAAAIADASAALAAAASASWVAGGASVFALFRRVMHSREQDEVPPSREVKAQVRRIKSKCRGLSRQARRVGGVFDDLSWQAPELSEQANELYRLLLTLRKAARDVQRNMAENPVVPRGVSSEANDEAIRREVDAARVVQERLVSLVAQNSRRQQICLAQIERIEDLVDAARLEITQPVDVTGAAPAQTTVVDEVETGLEAARRALEEVARTEA